jgi:DNA-binding PadR family transcriptional regulator
MNELTTLELTLLQLINEGAGKYDWYRLETRLSRMNVPRVPDMMSVLQDMTARGLVRRYVTPGSPRDRWEVTEKGLAVLQAGEANQRMILAR